MKSIKSISNIATLILSLAGAILATLLTIEHFAPNVVSLPCTKSGGGCVGTLTSAYGHVGPIPTAAFGLGMYVLLAFLCFKRLKALKMDSAAQAAAFEQENGAEKSPEERAAEAELGLETVTGSAAPAPLPLSNARDVEKLDRLIWALAALGCGISIWLQYIAIYVISSFCPYCFTSCCLVTVIFLLATRDAWIHGREIGGEQKMLIGVGAFILVMGSFLYVPQFIEKIQLIQHPPLDIAPKFVTTTDIVQRSNLHFKGDPDARFTLVEFADYQCPHCAKAFPVVDGALQLYPKDIRIAFRSFPLPMHKWARPAAEAAEAAALQGKFWEMHDYLFAHQKEMSAPGFADNIFDEFARALKLDIAKFDRDRVSLQVHERVMADMSDGERAKVESTPTFFFILKDGRTKKFGDLEYLKNGLPDTKSDLWKF